MLETDEQVDVSTTNTPNERSHMISCPPNYKTTAEWLATARAEQLAVRAICGYIFIPQRNPKKYKICEECQTEAANRLFGE